MKNNYQEIIDKFGEGRIGDVLDKIYRTDSSFEKENDLIFFWAFCGLTKSLSEILRAEMKEVCMNCATGHECECEDGEEDLQKKFSPKATELFQLLKTL